MARISQRTITMKVFAYLVIGILILTSCSTDIPGTDNNPNISSSDLRISDSLQLNNENIIGTWTNCSSEFDGVVETANECRTIEFKTDHKGVVKLGDSIKENFGWTISERLLRIELFDQIRDSFYRDFSDTLYQTTLTKYDPRWNLELKAKNKNITYHLVKSD